MADHDPLAPSLSDEESDALIPPKKTSSRSSPQRSTAKNQGYKFNADTNVKPDFDFKKSSESATNNQDPNTSSSDPDEGFEVLEPTEETDEASVPTTPVKITPHKRAADGDDGSVVTNGANGSPPSSPAPKKRKQFEEYLSEYEAKKKAIEEKENAASFVDKSKRIILSNYKIILAVVFAALAMSLGGYCKYTGNCPDPVEMALNATKPHYSWKKINANFVNWTKMLEPEFPKQNRGTWIQLIASISGTLKKTEPTHPAVITVLLPPSMSKDFATCFVKKVGGIVNRAVAPYYDSSPAEVKQISAATFASSSITDFRTEIETYFKSQGMAVITSDIDKFESEDNLYVIQGLCDSYHAVFKRATYLFPVQVSKEIFEKFDWVHERGGDIANDVLNDAWKTTLSVDSGPALVARVADAVIVLNEGDQCKL